MSNSSRVLIPALRVDPVQPFMVRFQMIILYLWAHRLDRQHLVTNMTSWNFNSNILHNGVIDIGVWFDNSSIAGFFLSLLNVALRRFLYTVDKLGQE